MGESFANFKQGLDSPDMADLRYDAVLFDLLTALLDSWTLWGKVAGSVSREDLRPGRVPSVRGPGRGGGGGLRLSALLGRRADPAQRRDPTVAERGRHPDPAQGAREDRRRDELLGGTGAACGGPGGGGLRLR